MPSDLDIIRSWAVVTLDAQAFDTASEKEAAHLFRVSLETTKAHLAWTDGASNSAGLAFRIAPGFVDIYTPNACADFYEDTFVIAMHSALFVAMTEFTMFCFAQSDFFADVGDPAKESSPRPINDKPPGLWLIDFTGSGGHVADAHSERLIPVCPVRYEMSIYLALLMARFVWMHELAHCYNGHIGLIRERKIGLRLNELADGASLIRRSERRTDDRRILHCLELDADRSALWSSMRLQTGKRENIEGIAALDEGLRHRLTLFGSYAMSWLFEKFQTYMQAGDSGSHPLPYLRLHSLMRTARNNLPDHIEGFSAIEEQVCGEFDFIRRSVFDFYASESVLKDRERSDLADEVDALEALLTEHRDALAALEFSQEQ